MGGLSEPALPQLEGLDSFQGTIFHSAQWDHEHSLAGERVAVIGTGASAVQFIPEIQPEVGELQVYQRTAPWIVPRRNAKINPRLRRLFQRFPGRDEAGARRALLERRAARARAGEGAAR